MEIIQENELDGYEMLPNLSQPTDPHDPLPSGQPVDLPDDMLSQEQLQLDDSPPTTLHNTFHQPQEDADKPRLEKLIDSQRAQWKQLKNQGKPPVIHRPPADNAFKQVFTPFVPPSSTAPTLPQKSPPAVSFPSHSLPAPKSIKTNPEEEMIKQQIIENEQQRCVIQILQRSLEKKLYDCHFFGAALDDMLCSYPTLQEKFNTFIAQQPLTNNWTMDFFLFLLSLFEKYPLQSDNTHHQLQNQIENLQEQLSKQEQGMQQMMQQSIQALQEKHSQEMTLQQDRYENQLHDLLQKEEREKELLRDGHKKQTEQQLRVAEVQEKEIGILQKKLEVQLQKQTIQKERIEQLEERHKEELKQERMELQNNNQQQIDAQRSLQIKIKSQQKRVQGLEEQHRNSHKEYQAKEDEWKRLLKRLEADNQMAKQKQEDLLDQMQHQKEQQEVDMDGLQNSIAQQKREIKKLREQLSITQQEQQADRDIHGQLHTQKVKIETLQEENTRLIDEVESERERRRRTVEEYWVQMGGTQDQADWQQKEMQLRERARQGVIDHEREDMHQENIELMADLQGLRAEHQEVTRRVIELEQMNASLSDQLDRMQPISQHRFQQLEIDNSRLRRYQRLTEYLLDKHLGHLQSTFRDSYQQWMRLVKQIITLEEDKTTAETAQQGYQQQAYIDQIDSMLFKLDNQKIQLEQNIRKQLQSSPSLSDQHDGPLINLYPDTTTNKSLKVSNLNASIKDYERSGKQDELKEEIRKLKRELENEEEVINHSYAKSTRSKRFHVNYNKDLYKESLDLSDELL